MLLSIIVTCYNEELALPLFFTEAARVAKTMVEDAAHPFSVEFIFVDDGSTDGTLPLIKALREKDSRVRFLSFSRNFGKEAGIYAGLAAAKGDLIAIIDADLQDPPSILPQMAAGILDEGYDCVGTRRVTRKGEPAIRSWFARQFYKLINRMSDVQLVDGARDFRMMTRQMVDAILQLSETNRFSKGLFAWVGFKTKWLEYENCERVAGETKWSFWKLFLYSMEGIISFSTMPLAISAFCGIICCIVAICLAIFYAVKALLFGDPVSGFPTLICCILLVGGLQLFCTGILSQYLAKTYLEVKRRPVYIIKEEG